MTVVIMKLVKIPLDLTTRVITTKSYNVTSFNDSSYNENSYNYTTYNYDITTLVRMQLVITMKKRL